jgi:hypothetical protein
VPEDQQGNGSRLVEATLDVRGTFADEAIRLPIQVAALHSANTTPFRYSRIESRAKSTSFTTLFSLEKPPLI